MKLSYIRTKAITTLREQLGIINIFNEIRIREIRKEWDNHLHSVLNRNTCIFFNFNKTKVNRVLNKKTRLKE
jgi:hypothetical protein